MQSINLEYCEYRLRKIGVKNISIRKDGLLNVETEEGVIWLNITSYEQTHNELDKEISRWIEPSWRIKRILEYFDEIWNEIDEFLNEKEKEKEVLKDL